MNKGTLSGLSLEDAIPPGVIWEWAGTTLPDPALYGRWAWADGSAVSRAEYARLFQHIGVLHGAGNGTTTFNLPNRQGRTGVGRDGTAEFLNVGQTGGSKTHTLVTGELPGHTHAHGHTHGMTDHNADHQHGASHGHNTGWTDPGNHTHVGTVSWNDHTHGAAVNTSSGTHDHHYTGDNQYATCPGGANSFAGYNIGNNGHNHVFTSAGMDATDSHMHGVDTAWMNTGWTGTWWHDHTTDTQSSSTTDAGTGGGATHNNLQPYVAMNYIVKV
jgi:microcystin-dependent protein